MRIIALQNYITFCKPGKKVLLLCVKKLKHIRIILSLLMLVECAALCLLGISAPEHARVAGYMQLSARAVTVSIAATAGAWLLWMCVTLLLGRVYCASFCPAGTVQPLLFAFATATTSVRGLILKGKQVWICIVTRSFCFGAQSGD